MARSLSTILSQIERLQKEADSIQSGVIQRVRQEIAKYGLTAEQLFGAAVPKRGRSKTATKSSAPATKAIKYADGNGNSWGGMGKRPDWLRQALEAGKALEEFLVGAPSKAAQPAAPARKRAAKASPAVSEPAKAKNPARKAAAKKPAAKRKAAAKAAEPTA